MSYDNIIVAIMQEELKTLVERLEDDMTDKTIGDSINAIVAEINYFRENKEFNNKPLVRELLTVANDVMMDLVG